MALFVWCYSIIIFAFPHSFPRFAEACCDFGLEFARFGADFINSLFGTQLQLPASHLMEKSVWVREIVIPIISAERWQAFWATFADFEVFKAWMFSLVPKLRVSAYLLLLVVPAIAILVVLFNHSFETYRPDVGSSKPLKVVDRFRAAVVIPARDVLIDFRQFLLDNPSYKTACLGALLFAAGIPTVIMEAFAWYFYLLSSFDFSRSYMTVVKLFLDVVPALLFVPFPVYAIWAVMILDKWRKKRGYNVLEHHEAQNRGFIASLPLVNFIWGTMGSKKTTLLTDMALSYSAYFRYKAYELLLECDLLYPDFPWICLERAMRKCMALPKGDPDRVYNLRSAGIFVDEIKSAWENGEFDLWGYEGKMESPDGLVINPLFEVLSDYAKLYLIYAVSSSLLISNYGIREDSACIDLGNFPQWSFDFFRKDPRLSAAYSRHSHVLDFDLFRLAKKVIKGNKDSDGFEFGVIAITEIGKDRGNQIENRRYKPDDHDANPTNDGFNHALKLCRHFGTVRHFPFVVFLEDDQRPESLNADARELTQLIRVEDCTEKVCAEPLRLFDDYIHDVVQARWCGRYQQFRFYRADSTLFMQSYKRFYAWLHKRYLTSHNTFDYFKADLVLERGTREGGEEHHPFYLSTKKIYSDRFATDAFAGFTASRVARSSVGLDDLPCYSTTLATMAEMQSTNSYLIRELTVMLRVMSEKEGGRR